MEESTEAHMETDVSSTTEDVPETQEVTGSNGNVEMVIVVEKVIEDEMMTDVQNEEQPSSIEENSHEVSKSSEEPLQMDTEVQIVSIKSPMKEVEVVISPSKTEPAQKLVNNLLLDSEIELSAKVQHIEDADSSMKVLSPIENVDSSMKDHLPIANIDKSKSVENSPKKIQSVDNTKSVENSPKKIENIDISKYVANSPKKVENIDKPKSAENGPNKVPNEFIEASPKKEAPKPVQISPIKELQINDSTSITPTKEPVLVEKFMINGNLESTDLNNDSNCKISTIMPIDITIERETSNDSQVETNSSETNCSDTTEKDQNKSISRELKSLINSAKESKIISECTQLTSKTRKSRSALDTSSTSLNTSMEADKIQGIRRHSNNSHKSNCSEKSEKIVVKRSMRSQNPEFVSKVKQFLNSVTGKGHKDSDEEFDDVEEKASKEKGGNKDKNHHNDSFVSPSKIKKTESPVPDTMGKLRSDSYCWRCHWALEQTTPMSCTVCPRSFHYKCLSSTEKSKINEQKNWVCPECMMILHAESSETRSQAMKKISLGMLCDLLKYALERMMITNGVEPFMQPVDRTSFPDYDKYIVHPMDLSQMQTNITDGVYGSTVAFLADTQWILHNSIIFNTLQSKLTAVARALVRSCRQEMGEIEACPECYAAAHARRPTWFTDVCTTPHILLWAKLKGFPYWPAKGMSVSNVGHVDVRFFGAHDRAWVPAKDCFLFCEKDPNNFRTKRQDIIDSMQEAEEHIRNISKKYGKFVYPPFKTPFVATKLNEHLKTMIPSFEGEVSTSMKDKSRISPAATKEKRRSNSKSSKSSCNDGYISENEDVNEMDHSTTVTSRKMADGAEIAREEEDTNIDKPESMNLSTLVIHTSKLGEPLSQVNKSNDTPVQINKINNPTYQKSSEPSSSNKVSEQSRKRRRSELEEAVITIMEKSNDTPEPKRKKNEIKHIREKKKSVEQESSSNKEVEQKSDTVEKSKKINDAKKNGTLDKDNEPSSSNSDSEKDKNQRVTPIRIALVQKDKRHNLRTSAAKDPMAKIINPIKQKDKEKDTDKTSLLKQRHLKIEKSGDKTPKDDKLTKSEKRRNSRNKSLNNTPKADKPGSTSIEKKSEKTAKPESEVSSSSKEQTKEVKDKSKENSTTIKEKDTETEKSKKDHQNSPKPHTENVKSVKERLQFDDDTSLAIIARESRTVVISNNNNNVSGLPTISCVRSLSTTAQNTGTVHSKTISNAKSTDVTITIKSFPNSSPISAESTTIADATSKLQKLRNDAETMVGRVGVRAFARMTSPEKSNKNDDVEIEIKAEPMDVDDPERQIEKLNLMSAFRLQPVNPPNTTNNLREVRINKVVVTPLSAKKTPGKAIEVRPRAKKAFPVQSKKPEDGQLNSKNSMVYIPIQPPMTQAPVRPPRVVAGPTCLPLTSKPLMSTGISTSSQVNTVTTPVMQVSSISSSPPSTAVSTSTSMNLATLGQVPTAVHTVPLMTSVNGQWMFSFQPIMSVGAIENSPSPPILNGIAERGKNAPPLVSLANAAQNVLPLQVTSGSSSSLAQSTVIPPVSRTSGETGSPGEPPRLQQRPAAQLLNPLDPSTPIGTVPTPSSAGPLTARLNQNAVKLTDFFRTLLEDSLEKLEEPAAQLTLARLQLEQNKWQYQAEIEEIKHNQELTLAEMRQVCEKEKTRAVAEARRAAQVELEAAVKAAKSKQWCANCSQEAQFYCCWNTSYCDYPCQRAHWAQHFNVCAQQRQDGSNNSEPPAPTETRLQSQPDNMPKSSPAPALTVGGKLAPSRVYTQDSHNVTAQKNAIIVSMVEDPSGNQTMKCVGTYKSPVPAQNVPTSHSPQTPIILNKQIMNKEENANKKLVSSGGYLIVGGGANSSSVVTPARRTHTIQYYS